MNYADIQKVNGEISTINLKGKDYAMVPERVNAFRKLFPEGFIKTEMLAHDGNTVVMQAMAGYYENGVPIILGTGLAQETKGFGMVNKTSYIENCETSAVGRALGMIGLGLNGGGICSAEELVNAVTAQNQMKEAEKAEVNPPIPAGGPVEKADKLPADQVANFIRNEITDLQQIYGLSTYLDARKYVMEITKELVKSGAVKEIDWKKITMDEAKNLFAAIRELIPGDDKK